MPIQIDHLLSNQNLVALINQNQHQSNYLDVLQQLKNQIKLISKQQIKQNQTVPWNQAQLQLKLIQTIEFIESVNQGTENIKNCLVNTFQMVQNHPSTTFQSTIQDFKTKTIHQISFFNHSLNIYHINIKSQAQLLLSEFQNIMMDLASASLKNNPVLNANNLMSFAQQILNQPLGKSPARANPQLNHILKTYRQNLIQFRLDLIHIRQKIQENFILELLSQMENRTLIKMLYQTHYLTLYSVIKQVYEFIRIMELPMAQLDTNNPRYDFFKNLKIKTNYQGLQNNGLNYQNYKPFWQNVAKPNQPEHYQLIIAKNVKQIQTQPNQITVSNFDINRALQTLVDVKCVF